jgi:hypothetical protein
MQIEGSLAGRLRKQGGDVSHVGFSEQFPLLLLWKEDLLFANI